MPGYSSLYSGGSRHKKRGSRVWVVLLVVVLLVGGGVVGYTQLGRLVSRDQAEQPTDASGSSLRSAIGEIKAQDAGVSKWALVVENNFGTSRIEDEAICKTLHDWYENRRREIHGAGNPFDNACTLYFNEEPIAKFMISSDDSRVMCTSDSSYYMILSDNVYDPLQNLLIAEGSSLYAKDTPEEGKYKVPDPSESLKAFEEPRKWDVEGWAIVVENEMGQTIIPDVEGVCRQLIEYADQEKTIVGDPDVLDNRIRVLCDGEEMLRLYSFGGEILLNEHQNVQMPFPQELAIMIEADLHKQYNSLYEGVRFAFNQNTEDTDTEALEGEAPEDLQEESFETSSR